MYCLFRKRFIAALIAIASASASFGAELVYRPINPAFGGNPFNGAFLLGTAQAQDRHKDPSKKGGKDDAAAQFTRTLQSRLLSGLANQISEALFGENPQDSGRIVFGDQVITFNRGLEAISIEIADANGSTTLIEVPTLQVEAP